MGRVTTAGNTAFHRTQGMYYTAIQTNGVTFSDRWGPTTIKSNVSYLETSDPEYEKVIAAGLDASGSYRRASVTKKGVGDVAVTEVVKFASYVRTSKGRLLLEPPYPSCLYFLEYNPEVDDLALKRLKARITEHQPSKMSAMVSLAETRELGALLRALVTQGSQLVFSLLSLRASSSFKKLSADQLRELLAEIWLTFSFAISPLISDIESLSTIVSEQLAEGSRSRFTVYGSAKHRFPVSTFSSGSASSFHNALCKLNFMVDYSVRYTAGYRGLVGSSLQDQLRLSPLEIIPTAWELIPFSWLFDYFTTIGDYLNDVAQIHVPPNGYLCVTRKWSGSATPTYSHGTLDPRITYVDYKPRSAVYSFFKIDRQVLNPGTLPGRTLRIKTFKEIAPTSSVIRRLLNLVSILETGRGRLS